jgi:hypothetical protein
LNQASNSASVIISPSQTQHLQITVFYHEVELQSFYQASYPFFLGH